MTEARIPTVSVAIPTYLGAAYIGAAIASVLSQSFSDLELIVIDDNSPDDTRAIVENFKDARLVYLRNERNLGPEGNWNRCLKEARGTYFKLLPHDDLLRPDCLKHQVAALEADREQGIALTFSSRDVLGPTGRLLMRRGYRGAKDGAIAGNTVIRACIRRGTNLIGEPGAVLFRKSLADKVGAFDGTNPYVIDLDYWFRLLAYGNAWYCTEPLAAFRVSAQQWSVVIGNSQSKQFMDFLYRVSERLPLKVGIRDISCARAMSAVNTVLRLAFYKLYLR